MNWNLPREKALEKAKSSMAKQPKQIVEDLYADLYNNDIPTVDGHKNGIILGHHAALLASMSQNDAETAEKNLKIQDSLIILTKWLLGITAILLVVALFQVFMMLKVP